MLGVADSFVDEVVKDQTIIFQTKSGQRLSCLCGGSSFQENGEVRVGIVARTAGALQQELSDSSRHAAGEKQKADIFRSVLDNLTDAVLMIEEDLIVCEPYSPAALEMFGLQSIEGKAITDFLFVGDESKDDVLAGHLFCLRSVFGSALVQWEINIDCVLNEVSYTHPKMKGNDAHRTFSIKYAPITDESGDVLKMLMVVTDLTEYLALKDSVAQQQAASSERVAILMELTEAPSRYRKAFGPEQEDRMARIYADLSRWNETKEKDARVDLFRELHTMKGNARALGFSKLSAFVHEIESDMLRHVKGEDDLSNLPSQPIDRLKVLVDQYIEVHDSFLKETGDQSEDDRRFGLLDRRLSFIEEAVGEGIAVGGRISDLRQLVRQESSEGLVGVVGGFAVHEPMIKDVAGRLSKELHPINLESVGAEIYVRPEIARSLNDAITHAVRNALDHGIETPREREVAGKPPVGRIWIEVEVVEDTACFRLCDDGRGIDPARVVMKARERGMFESEPEPTEEKDIIQLLFRSGLSTKSEVSELSGRGVGLDAVRSGLAEHGIEVDLRNAEVDGAILEIRIPRKTIEFLEQDGRVERLAATSGTEEAA
jgi:two-component system chemotaxis sensor kinase CheA